MEKTIRITFQVIGQQRSVVGARGGGLLDEPNPSLFAPKHVHSHQTLRGQIRTVATERKSAVAMWFQPAHTLPHTRIKSNPCAKVIMPDIKFKLMLTNGT